MPNVSLVTLGVGDPHRATAFYEALGWQRSSASVEGEVTFLRGGAVVLALWGRENLAKDANLEVERSGFGNAALAMNVGSEDAVDATLAAAEAAGGTIPKPAERADWGGYSGYFSDPDGHLWEVA
ncbi:MAG: VOC family protein, partial [Nitriliruptorales bacterium]